MNFKAPKCKKNTSAEKKSGLNKIFDERSGHFNGQDVTVFDLNSMISLYNEGSFGKGSLSRGSPNYHAKKDDIPKIIFLQQYNNIMKWNPDDFYSECCQRKYLEFKNSNLEHGWKSVNNFLQSSFRTSENESWKSWKRKSQINTDTNKNDSKNNSLLLVNELDKSDIDSNLTKLVEDILQSREGRPPNSSKCGTEEVVVVDLKSDSTKDEWLEKIKAKIMNGPYLVEENLKLNLEESFFLKFLLGSLKIMDLNNIEIKINDLWSKFNSCYYNFLERYATYHYYRTKGWIVKSGVKFGGDYLLYKIGPSEYHSSYLVQIKDQQKTVTWKNFIAMNRLVETFNKDLIFCNVVSLKDTDTNDTNVFCPDNLNNYRIQEVLTRRWFPSKERFLKDKI